MTDTKRILISVLGNSICAGMNCEDCHDLFKDTQCPIDMADRDERKDFCRKVLALLQGPEYSEVADEDLLRILLNE